MYSNKPTVAAGGSAGSLTIGIQRCVVGVSDHHGLCNESFVMLVLSVQTACKVPLLNDRERSLLKIGARGSMHGSQTRKRVNNENVLHFFRAFG